MSTLESLRLARKARLRRIAARAVEAPLPAASGGAAVGVRSRYADDPAYERAWAAIMLGILPAEPAPRRPRIIDIQRASAEHFGISLSELLSGRRPRVFADARALAMFLTKRFTGKSFPEIGRLFGGRDHSTVLHAVRRVERLIASDADFADHFRRVRAALEDASSSAAYPGENLV